MSAVWRKWLKWWCRLGGQLGIVRSFVFGGWNTLDCAGDGYTALVCQKFGLFVSQFSRLIAQAFNGTVTHPVT